MCVCVYMRVRVLLSMCEFCFGVAGRMRGGGKLLFVVEVVCIL